MTESKKNYEELAETLSMQDLEIIRLHQSNKHQMALQQKIEAQVPKIVELVGQYTKNQYVEQKLEVMPGLTCVLRSLSPFAVDESMRFANDNTKTDSNMEYSRLLARRRLAHALISMNEERMSTVQLDGNLMELLIATGSKYKEEVIKRADTVYEKLEVIGLTDKISETFGVWERVVYNRMNNIEDISEALKNSTRDSKTA